MTKLNGSRAEVVLFSPSVSHSLSYDCVTDVREEGRKIEREVEWLTAGKLYISVGAKLPLTG